MMLRVVRLISLNSDSCLALSKSSQIKGLFRKLNFGGMNVAGWNVGITLRPGTSVLSNTDPRHLVTPMRLVNANIAMLPNATMQFKFNCSSSCFNS